MSWQADLLRRHPDLFDPSKQPELTRGYPAVADGWRQLVEKAIERIAEAVADLPAGSVRITQIKEKLAGVRIYTTARRDLPAEAAAKIEEAIDLAEARSYCTCEICGAVGDMYDDDGWYATRCDRHAKGERLPTDYGADVHIKYEIVGGKRRVISCRRYDRERDAFADAPLPPGQEWIEDA